MKYKHVTKMWFAVIVNLNEAPKLEYIRITRRSDFNHDELRIKGVDGFKIITSFGNPQKIFTQHLIEKYGNVIGIVCYKEKSLIQTC